MSQNFQKLPVAFSKLGAWSCNRAALEILAPPPPGLNSQEPPTPPTVPVLAPLLPCTPSNPTGQPPTPPREQTPAKRPVSHRKREPFRPFLYAFFNSRNSPFYCCKKFNFSRSLNVSPIVAQSPDEIPLFTVSQNSENSLFNGVGKIGKFQPPPGVFLFLRPCCPGQVLSCPGPGIVGKTSTRGPWGRFSALAFPKLGAWSWERLAKRFKAPSPCRVCRFRRGCCPEEQGGFPVGG